ncbi:MAG: sulfur carrier protein ThiS [Maricaulis sp.]|uniref:sulfur carrier protein ThiS n=1 Tax=unclassified Maricaulis TaxID=2632371 RepID=UPI002621FF11|nr:sulfur carrier protein ThiS [Maricaulis sp.]MDM7983525.1 sulfur carrier protein ThiS [Maricaulis sp.]MEC9250097.1 sulfur carrier protein ThiS [Pseudomonadota bacterium]
MIELTVNGETKSVNTGLSVAGLLEELQINGRKVAVERNLEIVPKSLYADTQLESGDRLEIVAFVGGG